MRGFPEPRTFEDLAVLTAWMADRGYSARGLADAVEKPWKWAQEFAVASAALEHETTNPCGDAVVNYGTSDLVAYCGGTADCEWEFDAREEALVHRFNG